MAAPEPSKHNGENPEMTERTPTQARADRLRALEKHCIDQSETWLAQWENGSADPHTVAAAQAYATLALAAGQRLTRQGER